MNRAEYHKPVLVKQVLEGLALKPGGLYLDVTFGGGGHSRAILEADPTVRVIGLDWDKNAVNHAAPMLEEFGDRLEVIWGSFAHLYRILKKYKISSLNGILADFGTSQHQLFEADGFSFYNDTPLDMRMSLGHYKTTAADVVNFATEKELCQIFWDYGEESHAKRIVQKIIEVRKQGRIKTTFQLADLVKSVVVRRESRVHPATKVFQALRIFVNKELENMEAFFPLAFDALAPEGRLVCISFHSLEDRMVKQFFREKAHADQATLITKKALSADPEEINENASSRSAKLRVIEKIS